MKTGHVLILGSTGRVGRALAAVWPDNRPVLWQHRPHAVPPAHPCAAWDILGTTGFEPPVAVRGIVHLARGHDAAQEVALATAACDLGVKLGARVLIASSQAVYGSVANPVNEDTPCHPVSDYGHAKYAVETAVKGRATCLRIGNVAGCDMLLGNAARGRVTLDRFPDGSSPQRSWISPDALCQVIAELIAHDRPLPNVINVAQPGLVSMAELLAAADVDWDWQDAGAGALAALELDVSRLMQIVPLPTADAATLISAARASGWNPAP